MNQPKFYRILETGDIVKAGDLDKVLCHCMGELSVIGSNEDEYSQHHNLGLKCKKCSGHYTASPEKD